MDVNGYWVLRLGPGTIEFRGLGRWFMSIARVPRAVLSWVTYHHTGIVAYFTGVSFPGGALYFENDDKMVVSLCVCDVLAEIVIEVILTNTSQQKLSEPLSNPNSKKVCVCVRMCLFTCVVGCTYINMHVGDRLMLDVFLNCSLLFLFVCKVSH